MRTYPSQHGFSVKVNVNQSAGTRYRWGCASTNNCGMFVTADLWADPMGVTSCDVEHLIGCDSICKPTQRAIAHLAKEVIETETGKRKALSNTIKDYLCGRKQDKHKPI
jgi:hypothetical protein